MTSSMRAELMLDEAQAAFEAARQRAQDNRRRQVVQEIGGELGRVTVNGYGRLRSVKLDHDALLKAPEAVLATKIVEAVNRAERKAVKTRER